MSKEIKDMVASVRARLLAISKSQGKPFDQIMTFLQDRFQMGLIILSKSLRTYAR